MSEMKEILMKEPFGSAIDDACDQDRKFFEEHPSRTNYVRRSIPFKHGMESLHLVYTHVVQLDPGVRVRIPLKQRDEIANAAMKCGLGVRDFVIDAMKHHGHFGDMKDALWRRRFDSPET